MHVLARCPNLESLLVSTSTNPVWHPSILRQFKLKSTPHAVRKVAFYAYGNDIEMCNITDLVQVLPHLTDLDLSFDDDTIVYPYETEPVELPDLRRLTVDGLLLDDYGSETDYDLPMILSDSTLARIERIKTDHACRLRLSETLNRGNLASLREVVIVSGTRFTSCVVKVSHFAGLPNLQVLDLQESEMANESFMTIVRDVPATVVTLSTGVFTCDLENVDMLAVVKALKRKALSHMLLIGTFKSCRDYFKLSDPHIVKLAKRLKRSAP